MMNTPTMAEEKSVDVALIQRTLINKDLANLPDSEKAGLYKAVCESLGLNPITKPLDFMVLNGRMTLYVLKSGTDQLRKINNVSIEIVNRETLDGVYAVTARATLPSGRIDEDVGAVTIAGLKGDALCNALMKTITKSKRRVTLSICGLGWTDESELETIPGAKPLNFNPEAVTSSAPPPPRSIQVQPKPPAPVEPPLNPPKPPSPKMRTKAEVTRDFNQGMDSAEALQQHLIDSAAKAAGGVQPSSQSNADLAHFQSLLAGFGAAEDGKALGQLSLSVGMFKTHFTEEQIGQLRVAKQRRIDQLNSLPKKGAKP